MEQRLAQRHPVEITGREPKIDVGYGEGCSHQNSGGVDEFGWQDIDQATHECRELYDHQSGQNSANAPHIKSDEGGSTHVYVRYEDLAD